MGPPSNLPNFDALAREIGEGHRAMEDGELAEFYLAELKQSGVPIYERAIAILSRSRSRPSPIHRNLLELFGGLENVKVVTTNFDTHFERAAKRIWKSVPPI